MSDIIIVGAGCAGLTAAIYAARAGKTVTILENEGIGGQISTSPRVENYPGIKSISGIEFSDRLFDQASDLGVELQLARAEGIEKNDNGFTVKTEYGDLTARAVILATGCRHRHLGLPEEDRFAGKGVSYCAVCDGAFYKSKTVAVAGGGNAALQNALMLAEICEKVYLIHRRDTYRAEDQLVGQINAVSNIEPVLNATVSRLNGSDKLESVTVNQNGSEKEIAMDCLFVSIGQQADNAAFADLVTLDENGYIVAGEDCKTSCEGVFAAGDCRTKVIRQLTTAAADGAVAALAACLF
ncbi:MAG: FAD-dependent oxidoreductase [Clostridia bacterium]|nr:FAD-dependent oxidoreductase [Clostridia bacterium]